MRTRPLMLVALLAVSIGCAAKHRMTATSGAASNPVTVTSSVRQAIQPRYVPNAGQPSGQELPRGGPMLEFATTSEGWRVRLNSDGIERTIDGGRSWTASYTGRLQVIGLDFVNRADGWALTTGPALLRTIDGGRTWQPLAVSAQATLARLDFTIASNGWAVTNSRELLATTNGGSSWRVVGAPGAVDDVCAEEGGRMWIAEQDGGVARSDDAGATWTPSLSYAQVPEPTNLARRSPHAIPGYAPELGCSRQAVWVYYFFTAGAGSWIDEFERSTDGGAHWRPATEVHTNRSWGVSSPNVAWFTSYSYGSNTDSLGTNALTTTTDGGSTFHTYRINPQPALDVEVDVAWFLDAVHGWAEITTGTYLSGPHHVLVATSDGGATWTRLGSELSV